MYQPMHVPITTKKQGYSIMSWQTQLHQLNNLHCMTLHIFQRKTINDAEIR